MLVSLSYFSNVSSIWQHNQIFAAVLFLKLIMQDFFSILCLKLPFHLFIDHHFFNLKKTFLSVSFTYLMVCGLIISYTFFEEINHFLNYSFLHFHNYLTHFIFVYDCVFQYVYMYVHMYSAFSFVFRNSFKSLEKIGSRIIFTSKTQHAVQN